MSSCNDLSCKELLQFLGDYLDGSLEPKIATIFEEHLRHCPPCKCYLASYKDTIELEKACMPAPCSMLDSNCSEIPEELIKAIMAAKIEQLPRKQKND